MSNSPAQLSVRSWRAWLGLAFRLLVGTVMLVAGLLKVGDPTGFARDILAYQLVGDQIATALGYSLPMIEIVIGLLLLVGLLTRGAAAVSLLLLLAFMVGIGWAWSQGLSIDCGCFGDGGEVADSETKYPQELARDFGLALAAGWLIYRPASLFALDTWLFGSPLPPADDSDDEKE